MKINQLKNVLNRMQISPSAYNLDGNGRDDERLCLVPDGDGWEVYYKERGEKTTQNYYETEAEACQFVLDALIDNTDDTTADGDQILPVGSVVLLEGGTQKVMIIARGLIIPNGEKQVYFDYGAILYPSGLIDNQLAYFQSSSISKIIFEGYSDLADKNLAKKISTYVKSHPELIRGGENDIKTE